MRMGSFSRSTSSNASKGSHLPLPGSSSSPTSPTVWPIARGKSRQNAILRSFALVAILLTYLHLTSSPDSTELAQIDDFGATYDESLWSFQRSPRATTGDDDTSFTDYLNSHFPLDDPKFPPPHIWVTLSDTDFMPGAANLDVFARQLNEERRDKYGKKARRDTFVVTLCLDEGCFVECEKRGMYCYGGYERSRPKQILKATWPKLASLIEILPQRDLFFIDADVAIRQDPYPHLEPLMTQYDIVAQENNAFEHFNTGFLWMKQSQTTADAWAKVLEMDMQETSRDQYNFNTVLETTKLRIDQDSKDPSERPLPSDFTASNSLKVHVLNQRLFGIEHLRQNDPIFERHESLIHHMTCADDKWVKLYIAKAEGFWSDLDHYYTAPRRLISIEHLSASQAQITQLFKIVLAAAYYTGRSVIPPEFATITDLTDSPFVARHSPSTFPLSHLERAFSIPILEPKYITHAQSHLLGRSALEPSVQRTDRRWKGVSAREKQRRTDYAISLAQTSDIDLRRYDTFASLIDRLRRTDLADATHIRFVNAARDNEEPEWTTWDFSTSPVGRLRTCERLEDPWRCDEFCRGVEELKNGTVKGVWSLV